MNVNITPVLNEYNIENIRSQIQAKKMSLPYYSTANQAMEVVTDYDTFPYPRYFRGVANSTLPIVAEREAGWRMRRDECYKVIEPDNLPKKDPPNLCFQAPCSTVYPCYPEYLTKYSDKEALDLILNRTCTVQYR
jgi:hypothetical protein